MIVYYGAGHLYWFVKEWFLLSYHSRLSWQIEIHAMTKTAISNVLYKLRKLIWPLSPLDTLHNIKCRHTHPQPNTYACEFSLVCLFVCLFVCLVGLGFFWGGVVWCIISTVIGHRLWMAMDQSQGPKSHSCLPPMNLCPAYVQQDSKGHSEKLFDFFFFSFFSMRLLEQKINIVAKRRMSSYFALTILGMPRWQ